MTAVFHFEADPIENFLKVYSEASRRVPQDPHAISLATVNAQKQPSLRTVYYKGMVRDGFSFYTNYESQKSKEMIANPQVAALFFWSEISQQVRIEGIVEKLTRSESEAYFATRPRLSQLGAWASHQSDTIQNHKEIEQSVIELDKKYQGQAIPCPPHWGGFHLLPLRIEFWFGREGRLHERYVYDRQDLSSPWVRSMKAP